MSRPKITTILICLGIYIFFVILRFPYENLKGKIFNTIQKQTGITVIAEELSPNLFGWPGMTLSSVELSVPVKRDNISVSADSMTARVGLGSLIPFRLGYSTAVSDLKGGGDIYTKFKGDPKSEFAVTFDANQLNLAQFTFPGIGEPMQGKLSSDTWLDISSKELNKSRGDIDLVATNLVLPPTKAQFFVFPEFRFGTLTAKLNVKNGVAELSTIEFGGPKSNISGSLSGNIKLGKTFLNSQLNLTLRIQVSSKLKDDPDAAAFISLLNSYKTSKADNYAMRWNSPIQEMMRNPLPTAVGG